MKRISSQLHTADNFARRVLTVVRGIPAGRVMTYGDVAERAGRPGAARAVGNIMRECRDPGVPCHRVIAAGGALGGYGGRETVKRRLLELEGCRFRGNRLADFAERAVRWRARSERPPAASRRRS